MLRVTLPVQDTTPRGQSLMELQREFPPTSRFLSNNRHVADDLRERVMSRQGADL